MEFIDRVSTYPNRYTMTEESGNVSTVVLERADQPMVEGTPLNAKTFNSLYLAEESKNYAGCFYRKVDGGEVEYLNPPMILSTPQRSVKRYLGEPVYTVVYGAVLPPSGQTTSFKLDNYKYIVGLSVLFRAHEDGKTVDAYPNPWIDNYGSIVASAYIMNGSLVIKSAERTTDYSQFSALCIIEYTKEVL